MNDKKHSNDWTEPWLYKIYCSNCGGIVEISDSVICPLCDYSYLIDQKTGLDIDLSKEELFLTFMGAVPYTSFLLLKLMQEEWNRPINKKLFENNNFKTSPRSMIVLLFWMQFENLMDQLLSQGMKTIPKKISDHLLKRHQQIGSRIEILYPLIFDCSFKEDLNKIGYPQLADFLKNVQEKRNLFIHGNPEIIDDQLVEETVANLQDVQKAWIKLYNIKFVTISKSKNNAST